MIQMATASYHLSPISTEQQTIVQGLTDGYNIKVSAVAGAGKCLGFNTPILMFDGLIKMVQDIKAGEQIMGDDSTARNVLSLARGREELFKVDHVLHNESYIVNKSHILTLKSGINKKIFEDKNCNSYVVSWFDNKNISRRSKYFNHGIKKVPKEAAYQQALVFFNNIQEDKVVDISLVDYIKVKTIRKSQKLQGFKVGVDFVEKELPFDPYIIGVWLGDGSSDGSGITNQDSAILLYLAWNLPFYNCYLQYASDYSYRINGSPVNGSLSNTNNFTTVLRQYNLLKNKHIPDIFKINSREKRLKLLAGLLDTDGYLHNNYFEIIQKSNQLTQDIVYLCQSLGFQCKLIKCKKGCWYKGEYREGEYNRIGIYGKGLEEIPTLCPRKKAHARIQIKDALVTAITVTSQGEGDYYGFELDGNGRYLLGNFIVTHNTTSILYTCLAFQNINPNFRILCLTYNKRLKFETRQKIIWLGLTNVECHSYHSFGYKYYSKECIEDSALLKLVNNRTAPLHTFAFNLMLLDEQQDTTALYYRFICMITAVSIKQGITPQFALIGDPKQCIFTFNGADARYLTLSDQLFDFNPQAQWKKLTLSVNYRSSREILAFVNRCILNRDQLIFPADYRPVLLPQNSPASSHPAIKSPGIIHPNPLTAEEILAAEYMDSCRTDPFLASFLPSNSLNSFIPKQSCPAGFKSQQSVGKKPKYVICNAYTSKTNRVVFTLVQQLLREYTPDDIFILAPSVKSSKTPIKSLANMLTSHRINIFVPNSDNERIDADLVRGKVVFSTFHQIKGLERKAVVIFNFDNSYLEYYNKDWGLTHPNECPNEIYVALTRAMEQLILVHHHTFEYLPFINTAVLHQYADVERAPKSKNPSKTTGKVDKDDVEPEWPEEITVTDFVRFLAPEVIHKALSYLTITRSKSAEKAIALPTKVKQTNTHEIVSEITNTAVIAYYEFLKTKPPAMTIVKHLADYKKKTIPEIWALYKSNSANDIETLLKISNAYCASVSGYNNKVAQITHYKWLDRPLLDQCIARLNGVIVCPAIFEPRGMAYEVAVSHEFTNGTEKTVMAGLVDLVQSSAGSPPILWEFKCLDLISPDHFIQTAILAYLYCSDPSASTAARKPNIKLFNILTNELFEIACTVDKFKQMIDYLFAEKYKRRADSDNAVFLAQNRAFKTAIFR